MKQNRNIHVLPTDKPSRLIMYSKKLGTFRLLDEPCDDWKGRLNIYITSDEEIKEGDWFISLYSNSIQRELKLDWTLNKDAYKKIILTTDQDLIKDGVQAIDDEFLDWFVKNPSCEEVEIKQVADLDLYYKNGIGGQKYKIIIPKEERSYSEQDLKNAFLDGWQLRDGDLPFPKAKKKWFNEFKNK